MFAGKICRIREQEAKACRSALLQRLWSERGEQDEDRNGEHGMAALSSDETRPAPPRFQAWRADKGSSLCERCRASYSESAGSKGKRSVQCRKRQRNFIQ